MTVRAAQPEATGDPVLRVLLHRECPEARDVHDVCLTALQHFGIPYRVIDLADTPLVAEDLSSAAGVLIAHDHLGSYVGDADLEYLAGAVHSGLGIVSLDGTPSSWPAGWWDLLDLEPTDAAVPCALLRIADIDHPVTALREEGESVRVKAPVALQGVRVRGNRSRVLLDTGSGADIGDWARRRAVVVGTEAGAGRVVQCLASSRLWLASHVGHGNGLTDILWRSIIWSARRPFVVQAMPPFVTTRIDNVTGVHDDLTYVDVFNRHGYVAVLGLYLREVSDDVARVLQDKAERGLVECSAHTLDEDCRNLLYGNFDLSDRSDEELNTNFKEIDETFRRWGIVPARVVNADWGIVGQSAAGYLRERGQTLLLKPLRFNRAMYGDLYSINDGWRPRPFGNYDLVLDAHPDANDFYIAAVQLPRHEGIDFLQGCPTCGENDPVADLEKVARKGARMLRHGLDNLFFGCLLAHEDRLRSLAPADLDWVLGRIDVLLEGVPRFHRGYDEIASYAKSRDNSFIAHVAEDGAGELYVTVAGESETAQYLSFFGAQVGGHGAEWSTLIPGYCPLPPITGRVTVRCTAESVMSAPGGTRPSPQGYGMVVS